MGRGHKHSQGAHGPAEKAQTLASANAEKGNGNDVNAADRATTQGEKVNGSHFKQRANGRTGERANRRGTKASSYTAIMPAS